MHAWTHTCMYACTHMHTHTHTAIENLKNFPVISSTSDWHQCNEYILMYFRQSLICQRLCIWLLDRGSPSQIPAARWLWSVFPKQVSIDCLFANPLTVLIIQNKPCYFCWKDLFVYVCVSSKLHVSSQVSSSQYTLIIPSQGNSANY